MTFSACPVPRARRRFKSAYRKLAKKWHPDQNKDPKAAARFAEANTAYEILGDADKRGQFDRGEIDAEGKPRFAGFGAGGNRRYEGFEGFDFGGRPGAGPGPGPGGPGAGSGAEDIFSQLFGEAFRQAGRGGNPFQQGARPRGPGAAGAGAKARTSKGADINASLTVTLEDIASGAKKRILLPNDREVEVNLPKGVTDGQVIRLRGLGMESAFGEAGDVLLKLNIAPHERSSPSRIA